MQRGAEILLFYCRYSIGKMAIEEHVTAPDDAAPLPIDRPAMRRRVLGLAGPVIGENFLQTLLGIVDTVLVARLGAEAVAGVGSAQQVMFFLIAALSALAIGSSVLVAQAVGGGLFDRASILARQSLVWSVLFSLPLALGGFLLSAPIMSVFGLEPTVTRIGTEYLQVTMGTMVVLVGLFIASGVLRGAGDTRTPMLVTALANVVNAVLAYGWIYGHFGLPELGPVGSAWAAFVARALALALIIIVLWRGVADVTIGGWRGWRPDTSVARGVLAIGMPAALEQVLTSAAFFTLTLIVARLGTTTLAAHQIAFTALSFSFLPGFGFAIAATALVGQSVGAKRIEEGAAAASVATVWAIGWMSAIALVIFVFAEPTMRLFVSEPDVIAAGAGGLRVVALAQPFWAVLFVLAGALRGTGDTRTPLVVGSIGIWMTVGLAYVLVNFVGGGLPMVWASFLAIAPLTAFIYRRRFRRAVETFKQRMAATTGETPALRGVEG